jgi:DMSO reductase anchor subunit
MSREVIVLPAFIGLVGLWWLAERVGLGAAHGAVFPVLAIAGAIVLWYCTAMIYTCLRFIEEWAHPLTIANFTLIGLASGLLLACALAALAGDTGMVRASGPSALAVTLVAWMVRALSLRRNAATSPRCNRPPAFGHPTWCRNRWACQQAHSTRGSFFTVPRSRPCRTPASAFSCWPLPCRRC